jgi:hypothetical protein
MVLESVAGGAQVSSTFEHGVVHPVLACIEAMEAALKATADVQVMFMTPAEKRTALVELTRVEALVAGLRLRVMAVSDDVAVGEGARDVAALVTHHTRTDPGANRRDLALAEALDRRWTQVAGAVGQGEVNVAQAQVITHALDELPAETLGAEILAKAEGYLVAQASEFGPRDLRHLGRRILDVVAPEVGEQHEAEQLAAEERRAEKRTSLVSQRLGTGPRGSPSMSRTGWRRGWTPTWRRSPPRATTGQGRVTGSRSPASAVGRSVPCWRRWTRGGCPSMVGMRPR